MQYHTMLKQKHEMEAKEAAEAAAKQKELADKRKVIEKNVNAEQKKVADAKAEELAAEKAAEELIKAEEREKQSKKSFKEGGMKKGFLDKKK
jgi:phage terminase large subunit